VPSLKAQIRRLMPKVVRAHRILGGRLRGYRIVTSWHDYPGAILGRTERALLEWFERNVAPGETWLDVGAHYGYTAIALSRLVGPSGRVFAFEPVLSTAGHLARTRSLNRLTQLTVLPFGLGAPDRLRLDHLPLVRGMAESTVEAGSRLREALLIARLDPFWEDLCDGRERIDGVKVDVQGMELPAVRGMAQLLRRFMPKLVIELHHGVDRTDMLSVLHGIGYSTRPIPIDKAAGDGGGLLDDCSYAFVPEPDATDDAHRA
jgi:FkbM family methyltransferase